MEEIIKKDITLVRRKYKSTRHKNKEFTAICSSRQDIFYCKKMCER